MLRRFTDATGRSVRPRRRREVGCVAPGPRPELDNTASDQNFSRFGHFSQLCLLHTAERGSDGGTGLRHSKIASSRGPPASIVGADYDDWNRPRVMGGGQRGSSIGRIRKLVEQGGAAAIGAP
jgi:hypothetical protein